MVLSLVPNEQVAGLATEDMAQLGLSMNSNVRRPGDDSPCMLVYRQSRWVAAWGGNVVN